MKLHRTYSIEEVARLFGLHKNTVRGWQKAGLPPVDGGRPILFKGSALAEFLKNRRAVGKQPCGPSRLYCLPCRKPQRPAGGMVDFIPSNAGAGVLCGLCPDCQRCMFRRVGRARLAAVAADLDVQFPKAEPRLGECHKHPVKCDLEGGGRWP
ncbi:helix-turn-helix domain-containing protein [Ancylobacter terrae]|uniref:helix-turn-helix domain-containing protein n=1 Tax=Ancylobacter sp. sgz301288 TaxID=3342077 RepID=UPI00385A3303